MIQYLKEPKACLLGMLKGILLMEQLGDYNVTKIGNLIKDYTVVLVISKQVT